MCAKKWHNCAIFLNKISTVVTQVLNLARQHQNGRVTPEVTSVTFNFTEGWFRNSISTEVLNLARGHQKGRVDKKSTAVEFDFTEGWFRNSGLYDQWANNGPKCAAVVTRDVSTFPQTTNYTNCRF